MAFTPVFLKMTYVEWSITLRRLAGDEVVLKLVEQVKAYFLIPGTIVQVTEEDPSSWAV